MSAQSSSMHKITGSVRSTARSIVAAARLHPAGFAVPSAVIVVAIALVTFVTAVVVRVVAPNLFGAGSPPYIHPSTSQPRHRPNPQPVLAGPPILGRAGRSQGQGPAGSRGHGSSGSRELASGSKGAGSPDAVLAAPATVPITSGPTSSAGHNPASTMPSTVSVTVSARGPVTEVSQTATGVVKTVTTTVGQAAQGVTGAVGTVTGTVGAVTGTVGAVTGTVQAASGIVGAVTNTVGAVASAAESAAPVSVQVSVGSSSSAAGESAQSAALAEQTPAATATVSVCDPAGNDSPQPAVNVSVSVPGLG
jgi:hypothetical protein